MDSTVVDARARFADRRTDAEAGTWAEAVHDSFRHCRYCPKLSTSYHYPWVDHRRREPWPRAFGTCDEHSEQGRVDCAAESHPRAVRTGGTP